MKHIIPFVLFESKDIRLPSGLTKKQEKFLNKCISGTWSVNPTTGLVDIQGDFNCSRGGLDSLLDISFGHASGNFDCYHSKLKSLAGAPRTVDGNFNCFYNNFESLEGAPRTVGGDFDCLPNNLKSLKGAPQTINGDFLCDEFELDQGKWNMQGWVEVLNTGSEKAQKLILTLPYLQPEYWNSKIKEEPKETILQMVSFWDYLPKENQDGIQIPSNWKDSFENLLDLERAGIF